jgi:hypothetical protein
MRFDLANKAVVVVVVVVLVLSIITAPCETGK